MDKLHQFYVGRAWRDLSYRLKIERGGKCERCGWTVITREDWARLIGHHRIELNDDNVDDPNIALNPERIEIICNDCHNKEHRRFGHRKQVFVVWGAPLSGKSSLVREIMRPGDIVMDMDALWMAVTLQPEYVKPDNVRFNVFALRDNLLDQIKTRYGQWYDAYIVGGYPDKYERERLAQTLGAELIHCEATFDECLRRRAESNRPERWDGYIRDWFEKFNGE